MTSLTLAHRRGIDRAKESLVQAAEQLLIDAQVTNIRRNDFGHSQLRNIIAVALETESPAVVLNFIRYQMGRDTSRKAWSSETGGIKLGQRFIDEIESGKVAQAFEALKLEDTPELRQLVKIELVRHFLGFASRYLKFLDLQRKDADQGGAS